MKVVLDEEGKIQLPEAVKSQLRLRPGDPVSLEQHEEEWILRRFNSEAPLHWKDQVLVYNGAIADSSECLLAQLRENRMDEILQNPWQ
ncbi:MAG: hypothetical protein L0387_14910 [Acidobacteria bacterium]|nr:hypothetical protein [Acidobacteriota bacterium]MCI0622922.1 hypothetical protein [Acidobacteriota bacterium]